MGLSQGESTTNAVTILTVQAGDRTKFRNIKITCDKCGKITTQNLLILEATNEICEKNYRMFRRFVSETESVCPNCENKELWVTSDDAPWIFSPGCGMLFDSDLLSKYRSKDGN